MAARLGQQASFQWLRARQHSDPAELAAQPGMANIEQSPSDADFAKFLAAIASDDATVPAAPAGQHGMHLPTSGSAVLSAVPPAHAAAMTPAQQVEQRRAASQPLQLQPEPGQPPPAEAPAFAAQPRLPLPPPLSRIPTATSASATAAPTFQQADPQADGAQTSMQQNVSVVKPQRTGGGAKAGAEVEDFAHHPLLQ